MVPEVDRNVVSDELPKTAPVIIIGGGIIGVSAAFFLAERGIRSLVIEKGIVAGEQSGRNWGWCRTQNRDVVELPMMKRSMDLWDRMTDITGVDVGFRRGGALHVAETTAELNMLQAWHSQPEVKGLGVEAIGQDEISGLLPQDSKTYLGGLYTKNDGRAEPQLAAPALARAAQKAGARVVTNCAVLELTTGPGGRVTGVSTERGAVSSDTVIVAGGIWSARLVRKLGIHLPQLRVLCTVLRTEPAAVALPMNIAAADFCMRLRDDGGYSLSAGFGVVADFIPDGLRYLREYLPLIRDRASYGTRMRFGRRFFEELGYEFKGNKIYTQERICDPAPYAPDEVKAVANAQRAIPALGQIKVAQSWAGLFDVMPDALPVISAVEGVPGLVLSTGYSGHGFGLGPGAGEITAELAVSPEARSQLHPFRLERFSRSGDADRPR